MEESDQNLVGHVRMVYMCWCLVEVLPAVLANENPIV